MNPAETLRKAADLLDERGKKYGGVEKNFARIANIASVILGRDVTEYECAVILLSTKLGRVPEDPAYDDNWVDGVNYAVFCGLFAGRKKGK